VSCLSKPGANGIFFKGIRHYTLYLIKLKYGVIFNNKELFNKV